MKTRLSWAAKAAGRAIVGLWREDTQGNEWCAADTLIADVEDADEEFLGRIARRHLGLPWAICETERLKIREIAEGDYEEIVENHVDADPGYGGEGSRLHKAPL